MSQGRIEVIAGGMFSGKTEELIRRAKRAKLAALKVMCFKHSHDVQRYGAEGLASHSGQHTMAIATATADQILACIGQEIAEGSGAPHVVCVDEAQFYDDGIIKVGEHLSERGVRVIFAGLDMTSEGQPFGPMPLLMAISDDVFKPHAVCMVCGADATHSFHKAGKQDEVEVGADTYEARCRYHWNEGRKALYHKNEGLQPTAEE